DQQQDLGRGHALSQHIEKSLGFAIDPVQVFADEDEGLIETLAQEQALKRLKVAPAANLWVHLLQRGGRLFNTQERKEIRQGIFQAAIECQHFAGDLLLSLAFVILWLQVKITLQQLNH